VKDALWKTEHDQTVTDPFSGVTVVVDGNPMDARRPLTIEELIAIRERVRSSANADLLDIWTVLEFTGCRLSEVRGLDRKDVILDASCPFIRVRWTDDRRLKTKASDRDVPLHPEAVAALHRALGRSGASQHVFPAYMYDGAGEALSGALMKHVRAVTDDPLAVTHSLRHNIEDRLLIAQVAADLADRFIGHSSSEHKMRQRYGGREGLLRAKAKALAMAFPEIAASAPQDAPQEPPAASL
jgi:integrase